MKKIFFLMAAVLVSSLFFTSCGSDDEDSPKPTSTTPTTPENTKFDVFASVVLDKNLAQYGHLEVTYTYKDKSESLQLKKDDNSDQFPTTNSFATTVLNSLKKEYGVDYLGSDFIIRNVVIRDLDKKEKENAEFTLKFIADPEHPEFTEESNRTFIYPNVLGFTDGGLSMVRSSLRLIDGMRVSKFEEWLTKRAEEATVIFGPDAI